MKVTVAIDSFKGSLSTFQSGNAVKEGILSIYPDATVNVCPVADGGEGTVDAVIAAAGGEKITLKVCNPLGKKTDAYYGIIPETSTAVIEMASAAGITLIEDDEKNPLKTTTYGVGEMILDAVEKGCRNFIIGIGGSATNDGGIGMLQALGFEFLDDKGNQVPYGAEGLENLVEIRNGKADKRLGECIFNIACDVKNPLCGSNGCSAVYGPQKGATPGMIKNMDKWLMQYARITKEFNPLSDPDYPGSGAAGGMGFAFLSFLNGKLLPGIDLVIKETGLEKLISSSDIVITGEGRLDGQSYMGKAPVGIAKLAKKYNKVVVAFSGCITDDAHICNNHGIDAFFPILKAPCNLSDAMNTENAYKNLKDTAIQAFRLIKICSEIERK